MTLFKFSGLFCNLNGPWSILHIKNLTSVSCLNVDSKDYLEDGYAVNTSISKTLSLKRKCERHAELSQFSL